jgi:hypothetical protein
MSARERLPNRRLSESFSAECALDVNPQDAAAQQRRHRVLVLRMEAEKRRRRAKVRALPDVTADAPPTARQAPQASCQRGDLMTAGEHGCTPSRRPDANLAAEHELARRCESAEVVRAWRLLDENVSLQRAWSEIHDAPSRAAASTVEALMYSLRAGGAGLDCPHARRRLAELSEAQLHEVSARLQKIQPNIARPWTPVEAEMLVAVWVNLHG